MLTRVLPPILIIAIGIATWFWLGRPVEKPKPVTLPEQLVKTQVLTLQPTDYQTWLDSQGIVRAHYVTTITPLVPGTIVALHPQFEDGAFFEKDQILAELDPADFQAALATSEARVARAEAILTQEQARAKQARLNWNDIGYKEDPSDLVLRVPQLKEAEAAVKAAKADLDQAHRNLERTKIRAPFTGRVKDRTIGLGQAVGQGTALGTVFASDFAEIRLPIPPNQLDFVTLPLKETDPSVEVLITDALVSDSPTQWKARIVRTEGTLDESTRELFAIARIDDPFGTASQLPPLSIGQPVRARIKGKILQKIYVLPRNTLRGLNRVIMVTGTPPVIARRDILPLWSNATEIIVKDHFQPGELLSTSSLPYAPEGAKVEILPAPENQPIEDKKSAATSHSTDES